MRDKKGQVLVEVALVLPLLLVFTFAVIDYGRAMFNRNSLTNAARSGARAAAVIPRMRPEGGPLATSSAPSETAKIIIPGLASIDPAEVNYRVSIFNPQGTEVAGTASTGDTVRVTVTQPAFRMITPLASIMALLTQSASPTSNTLTIVGEAAVRYE